MIPILRVIVAILISCFALAFAPWPYVWVFLSGSVLCLSQIKRSSPTTSKALWFNLGIVLFIFAIAEAVLSRQAGKATETEARVVHVRAYETEADDILGHKLLKNRRWHAKKFYDGKPLYDVVVTVGDNGLRITPPCRGDCPQAILFFGCSFTYGQGVEDNETLPYQVGLQTGGQYATYNFAVHGYGTHQMLAAVEKGLVASRVKEDARYIIYQAIYPEHLYRLAGLRSWSQHDPKYTLDKDGQPRYVGQFDDDLCRRWICAWVAHQLEKSVLITKATHSIQAFFRVDDALFVAMVVKSRELLLKQFPKAEFHMIIWDQAPPDRMLTELRNRGITVHLIRDVLPNRWERRFQIAEEDGHPSALAYRIVSEYVMRNIIRE